MPRIVTTLIEPLLIPQSVPIKPLDIESSQGNTTTIRLFKMIWCNLVVLDDAS